MGYWREHLDAWWRSLAAPRLAGPLILDGAVKPGFLRLVLGLSAALYGVYGLSMGLFAGPGPALLSMLKLPLLYLATVAIAAPCLYVLNATLGGRLAFAQCLRLVVLSISANALALASYAPVSFFFVLTAYESTYRFLVLMHLLVFAASGFASVAMIVLLSRAAMAAKQTTFRPGAMVAWGLLYGIVGSQMSWALRPWIGSPKEPYTLYRPVDLSFFEAMIRFFG